MSLDASTFSVFASFWPFPSWPWQKKNTETMASGTDSFPIFHVSPATSSESLNAKLGADSYFPSSRRSSVSSNSSAVLPPDFGTQPAPPTRNATTPATSSSSLEKAIALDALQRQYPAPTQELSLEEMLARPPQKWSIGHYVKNAREAKPPVPDKEQRAKAFEEAKKELLAAKEQMKRLAFAGR